MRADLSRAVSQKWCCYFFVQNAVNEENENGEITTKNNAKSILTVNVYKNRLKILEYLSIACGMKSNI